MNTLIISNKIAEHIFMGGYKFRGTSEDLGNGSELLTFATNTGYLNFCGLIHDAALTIHDNKYKS